MIKLIGFEQEGIEMSVKEICEKTITAIKNDIFELKREFSNLHRFEYDKRMQKLKAIRNCRELIEDLKQEIINKEN